MAALSTRNDDPEHASRPFDADRDGFVMGEGAAALVLETLGARASHAAPRIYGEVLGYGRNADAYHITAPSPGGAGAAACMQLALDDAGLDAADIGHVNAHGTSTPLNDAAEAEAIRKVFGDVAAAGHVDQGRHRPPRSARAGATEAVIACLLAIARRHRCRPPPTSSSSATTSRLDVVARRAPRRSRASRRCRTRSASAATTPR